jgi:surface polysaccharide O-acyltransferase-like enzyme
VITHTCSIVGIPKQYDSSSLIGDFSIFLFENFSIVAVNCFVLISGYFSIKFKVKSLISLYLQCLFYVLLLGCINNFNFQNGIRGVVFALSESNLWFIQAYVGLMLISPILNIATKSLSKQQFIKILILLTICNVYFGYLHQSLVNDTGYTLMQFVYVYIIGRYISMHDFNYSSKKYVCLYVCLTFIMSVLALIRLKYPIVNVVYSLHYNSPLVLLSSVVFFMFFASLKFQSKLVNYISISALSVYLIHQNTNGWAKYVSCVKYLQVQSSGFFLLMDLTLLIICVFILSIIIDKIRILIMTPIQNMLMTIIDDRIFKIKHLQ